MIYYDEYIRRAEREVKPLNFDNLINWCKKQLKKSYNDFKVGQLEIARDEIISKYNL